MLLMCVYGSPNSQRIDYVADLTKACLELLQCFLTEGDGFLMKACLEFLSDLLQKVMVFSWRHA